MFLFNVEFIGPFRFASCSVSDFTSNNKSISLRVTSSQYYFIKSAEVPLISSAVVDEFILIEVSFEYVSKIEVNKFR